ncbi:sugar phosphate isomerase/epimerase family protein [Rhizorhabdus dicambivorans]|uniref:sugar phosphate isomerase/epimerase family protein n=1 Tax=Rhizorhabdus dicambivorans TaxID=1850238 RepID=UPI001596B623|nr:sugar phosphate isomerase/epimerase family protein [Rhizorhabdus dicambivorans]
MIGPSNELLGADNGFGLPQDIIVKDHAMSVRQRLSVCELSLPDTSFEQDLDLIRASGATGIAISEFKLRDGEEEQQIAALKESGLAATICIPANTSPLPLRPDSIFPGPADPDLRLEAMLGSIRRIAMFEPDCILTVTGSNSDYDAADARKIAVEALREATALAVSLGTRLALETNRNEGLDFSFLRSLPETIDFLDEIGPGIGLLYDFYHLWDEDNIIPDTERFASRIFGVQYNDWREPPRSFADRLLPGDGIMDIPALLGALERGGYTGWYDFEIFSDDGRWGTELPDSLWKIPYDRLIERAHAGLLKAWDLRI